MRRNVYINYPITPLYGWGVYGLNLVLAWANDPEIRPIGVRTPDRIPLVIDPLRQHMLANFFADSAGMRDQLVKSSGKQAVVDAPMLSYLEWDFHAKKSAHDVLLTGKPTIGVVFFESADLHPVATGRAKTFPCIVTGSTWNERVLRAHGVTNVRTVLQGIDPTLFHVAPAYGFAHDRFLVFSGGKLERRKGQDLALAAFAKFSAKRPDAILVTAWHGIHPPIASTLDASGVAPEVPFTETGKVDVVQWAKAAGVAPNQIIDLGVVPNPQMAPILREMDAAIFPNRAEGGTNLVAMECMACGVPTILSRNTGHIDLIEDENCFPLNRQAALAGGDQRSGNLESGFGDVPGWGESDVDEIVDALERIYLDREAARARGLAGAETMKRLTWAETARRMKAVVLEELAKTAP